MSANEPPSIETLRGARVFDATDATVETADDEPVRDRPVSRGPSAGGRGQSSIATRPTELDVRRGVRWGHVFWASALGLVSLAAGIWVSDTIATALSRNDWIGWIALGLTGLFMLSVVVITLREVMGIIRLGRLESLRHDIREALAGTNYKAETAAVSKLQSIYLGRADVAWGIARFRENAGDLLATGDRLRLAEREIIAPLDAEARRIIAKSAKRVATLTTLSPLAAIAVGFVLVEALRMIRAIAAVYGGHPGWLGGVRLAKLVAGHIIATGGLAMTDDLLGQIVGHDLLGKVSRRLGEGAFNGALTARLGVAAIETLRPIPHLETPPIRARDLVADVVKSLRG